MAFGRRANNVATLPRAYRQLETLMDRRLQERSDLTLTDYVILVNLSEAPDRKIRMNELADITVVSRSRMTYRIDSLVRRGYIDRVICDDDRRGLYASLTDEGFTKLAEAAPDHVEDVRSVLFDQIMPDEYPAFSAAIIRIATGMRELG
ncbi:MAG: MarR family transcriptional regulator [Acidimicrobiales bacterium]